MNTLDTVFDLEETPTQFSYLIMNDWPHDQIVLFEYDRNISES